MKLLTRMLITCVILLQILLTISVLTSYAQIPHMVGGTVKNSWGATPAEGSLGFSAYITVRPGEVLSTGSSTACTYQIYGQVGYFSLQCASFPTVWSAGEICHIDFLDQNSGETGSVEVVLTNNSADNAGEVILTGAVESVNTPTVPGGPSTGYVQQSLSFNTSGSSCSFAHPVEYQIDFGDGTQSSWSSSGLASHSYAANGTFQVKARARCQVNNSIISDWSGTHSVSISYLTLTTHVNPGGSGTIAVTPDKSGYDWNESVELSVTPNAGFGFDHWGGDLSGNSNPETISMNDNKDITAYFLEEIISTPNQPAGYSSGYKGMQLSFTASGATSNLGHAVEYQFDWGDGNQSPWGSSTQNHTYNSTGSFQVKARARCQTHTDKVSNWSNPVSINITLCDLTISISPSGAGNVAKNPDKAGYDYNESVTLTATPADARYQFDHWTDDLSGTTNPETIAMTGTKSVTAVFVKETVSTPATPTGPDNGMVQQNLNFTVTGSSSSFGHAIEYRFNFGDGVYSDWGSGSASHTYTSVGTYQVKAQARCQTHTDIVSYWSGGHPVSISAYTLAININPPGAGSVSRNPDKQEYNPNETVEITAISANGSYRFDHWSSDINSYSNPETVVMDGDKRITAHFIEETVSKPTVSEGPASAYAGQQVTFRGTGATSSFGHAVYYRFNWGDGNVSPWGLDTRNHTYQQAGSYNVGVQARCVQHADVVSEWSDYVPIEITSLSISVSVEPANSGTVTKNPDKTSYVYNENVTLTAQAAALYTFDHWTGDADGTSENANLTMDSNKNATAHFRQIDEVVSNPDKPLGPDSGIMGEEISFSVTGASSNLGHSIEYQYNWGDGSTSDWGAADRSHTYTEQGVVNVSARARCAAHTDIISGWSDSHAVSINGYHLDTEIVPAEAGTVTRIPDKSDYSSGENVVLIAISNPLYLFDLWSGDASGNNDTLHIIMDADKSVTAHFNKVDESVSIPDVPVGPSTGIMGQSLAFGTENSVSNLGHAVEYQFDWGDGNLSDWSDGSDNYTYMKVGLYEVKARARCQEHVEILSGWSQGHEVTIDGYELSVTINPEIGGTVAMDPDSGLYAMGQVVTLAAQPEVTYQFDGWTGDYVDTSVTVELVMDSDMSVVANFSQIPEVVTRPDRPVGPADGIMGIELNLTVEGAVSNLGHKVEYQYDFGDSSLSDWGSSSVVHTYESAGEMAVKARARCAEHTQIESEWSEALVIVIRGYSLIITSDPESAGDVQINPHKDLYSNGEAVELIAIPAPLFLFDRWSGDVTGTEDTLLMTMDSDKTLMAHFRQVDEIVSIPDIPSGPEQAIMGDSTEFTAIGSESNLGHEVEYQFDWGNGDVSDWGDGEEKYIFHKLGEFEIRARARCKEHTDIQSNWSDPHRIVIYGYHLSVSVDPEIAGSVLLNPDEKVFSSGEVVTAIAVPDSGFLFEKWEGDIEAEDDTLHITMNNDVNITAVFKKDLEYVSTPVEISGRHTAYRGQSITFSAEGAVSNKSHDVEYQFDWGNGSFSEWGDESTQINSKLTMFTSAAGNSGLPTSGRLINYGNGTVTDIHLEISGGCYEEDDNSANDIDLKPDSDAFKVFNGFVDVNGYIKQHENPGDPFTLTFTNLDPAKRYEIVIYSDRGEDEWNTSSCIELSSADFFMNESSFGTDMAGNLIFAGEGDPSTVIPAGNSEYGYVARFTHINSGVDSCVVLSISGYNSNGEIAPAGCVNAIMLTEREYPSNQVIFTSYNDMGWSDSVYTHKFQANGTYAIRARARCKIHTDVVSDWSEPFELTVTGCRLIVNILPQNDLCSVVQYPDLSDYDYNARVELRARGANTYEFLNWDHDVNESDTIKIIHIQSDTMIVAHFEIVSEVETGDDARPFSYRLHQNYPNPFNPETRISYEIPEECYVTLTIYNALGQRIKTLIDRNQQKGEHFIIWDATDADGNRVNSGVYFGILKTNEFRQVIKITLMK